MQARATRSFSVSNPVNRFVGEICIQMMGMMVERTYRLVCGTRVPAGIPHAGEEATKSGMD
jgi:hypothetical protein